MSKRNVQFIKQDEASFIKKIKQSVGYSEGPDVDTKREQLPDESDSDSDKDDEKPQIVVLKKGHLTKEEVEEFERKQTSEKKEMDHQDLDEDRIEKRIMFKKPTEKKCSDVSELNPSSKKIVKTEKIKKKSKSVKEIKNKKLLSFDDEEEEEYY